MEHKTRIEPTASDPNLFNLYVDGHIAVSYERWAVCDCVATAIHNRTNHGEFYSTGAEIADVVRRTLRAIAA